MISSLRQLRDLLMLSLWGAFILGLAARGNLSTYLHPSLQPYTVAAGVILFILAGFALRGMLPRRKNSTDASCRHDHSCCHAKESHQHEECHIERHDSAHGSEHEHAHHTHDDTSEPCDHHHGDSSGLLSLTFKTLLLILPLGMFFFGQTNHYTMATVQNRGVVQDLSRLPAAKASSRTLVTAVNQTSNAVTPSGAMPIQIIDMLYAVQMPSYREEFEGKQVELTGQFVPLTTGNAKGDRFQVIRLFVTCCAADAKPVGVTVQYDKPLKVSEMDWLKITGTPTFPLEGGKHTAILVATKVEPCAAPAEPFVY